MDSDWDKIDVLMIVIMGMVLTESVIAFGYYVYISKRAAITVLSILELSHCIFTSLAIIINILFVYYPLQCFWQYSAATFTSLSLAMVDILLLLKVLAFESNLWKAWLWCFLFIFISIATRIGHICTLAVVFDPNVSRCVPHPNPAYFLTAVVVQCFLVLLLGTTFAYRVLACFYTLPTLPSQIHFLKKVTSFKGNVSGNTLGAPEPKLVPSSNGGVSPKSKANMKRIGDINLVLTLAIITNRLCLYLPYGLQVLKGDSLLLVYAMLFFETMLFHLLCRVSSLRLAPVWQNTRLGRWLLQKNAFQTQPKQEAPNVDEGGIPDQSLQMQSKPPMVIEAHNDLNMH